MFYILGLSAPSWLQLASFFPDKSCFSLSRCEMTRSLCPPGDPSSALMLGAVWSGAPPALQPGEHLLPRAAQTRPLLCRLGLPHVCVLSHVQLFATPWTVVRQAPLSTGFSRQEYWSWLHFLLQGNLPNQGSNLASPALAGRVFTTAPPGKSLLLLTST